MKGKGKEAKNGREGREKGEEKRKKEEERGHTIALQAFFFIYDLWTLDSELSFH